MFKFFSVLFLSFALLPQGICLAEPDGAIDDGGNITPTEQRSNNYIRNQVSDMTDEDIKEISGGDQKLENYTQQERKEAQDDLVNSGFKGVEDGGWRE